MSESRSCAHDGEVVVVACDSTNTLMINAGYQGDLKVWDFKERGLKSRWEIGCSVVKIVYHPYNGTTFPTQDKQIPDLVTLSLLPKSQWQSLINLDIIKVRNKPIEPPKKPEKAPFFLPSVPLLSEEILFELGKALLEEKDVKDEEKQMNKERFHTP
ncbi:uncharacterized protein [Cicer arietinum]|uniref:U3 small nucleolar RNA-associated protein 21-like n=1 Tax=Cicer arietinum TaxID=3827 RepID=A0A3Q7Y455_CICAR|nr:U3 small nucleolar RNA-associated protein 21-like [Cicer arietinum]